VLLDGDLRFQERGAAGIRRRGALRVVAKAAESGFAGGFFACFGPRRAGGRRLP